MHVTPYLNFDGKTAEALAFYADVLGGKVDFIQTFAESPMADDVSPEWRDRVIHGSVVAGDVTLMASDSPPGQYERPQGLYVSLHLTDVAEAERIFARLAEGGTVGMPLEKTFWAERFGYLSDRFGTPWMINCSAESS